MIYFLFVYVYFLAFTPISGGKQITFNKEYCHDLVPLLNESNAWAMSKITENPGYSISIASATYDASTPFNVTVSACPHLGFKAFMVQARLQGSMRTAKSGFSYLPEGASLLSCQNRGDSIISTTNRVYSKISFLWRPHASVNGNLSFIFSIVPNNEDAYWISLKSPTINPHQDIQSIEVNQPCAERSNGVTVKHYLFIKLYITIFIILSLTLV